MPDTPRRLIRGQSPLPQGLRHPVGAVIGREGRTVWYLTHRGAPFAATDRSYEGSCFQREPVTATNPPRRSAPLGFW